MLWVVFGSLGFCGYCVGILGYFGFLATFGYFGYLLVIHFFVNQYFPIFTVEIINN